MVYVRCLTGVVFAMLCSVGLAAAMPPAITLTQLLDFCGAQTITEAEAKGDQFGWRRMTGAELDDWRTGFIAYNGGPVEVSGWRRGDQADDDSLSFWVARGPNGHKACAYTANSPARLMDDLSERFGAPTSLDKREFGTTAVWKRGSMEISLSQIGSGVVLYVFHSD